MTERETKKSRYWISWAQPTDDFRPLTFPPNEAILGWWRSGYDSNDHATICALVEVDHNRPELATVAIIKEWPEVKEVVKAGEWRFFNRVDSSWNPTDRFVREPWMTQRGLPVPALSNQEGERQRCLDELVRTAQEDGDYDPPTKEGERT
jgi:hypothetical protein